MPTRSKMPSSFMEGDFEKSVDYLRGAQKELRERHRQMREMHAAIRSSHARYQDLFDSAPMGYVTTGANGRIIEVNHAATLMLGDRGVLSGRTLEHFVCLESRRLYEERFARCRRGRPIRSFEVAMHCKYGPAVPVMLNILRSKSVPGRVREFRFVMMDLTTIKAVQLELEDAKRGLEARVNERTRELTENLVRLAEESAHRARLEEELLQISERERRRFGQDLHDDICQGLTGLSLEIASLSRKLAKEENPWSEECHRLATGVADLVQNTRQIAQRLHPVELNGGLIHALEGLVAGTSGKVPCRLRVSKFSVKLRPEVELALYRIAQEALTNVSKHSRASRAELRLLVESRGLLLSIQDDGDGLPTGAPQSSGMGLDILGYRARSIGGQLVIENLPSRGVRVTCRLPASVLKADTTR